MNPHRALALVLDPAVILLAQGLTPDPWQHELLLGGDRFRLLNCSRQSGKSTTVAALALHQALVRFSALVLLVAPSERQSGGLFRKILAAYRALGRPAGSVRCNQHELEMANGSRIVALPGREDTIRSFSGVNLLVIDEAARVPDDLYRAVRPMIAVSEGRLVALSTPFGKRGWFHDEWIGSGPWKRVCIPWSQCPRISPAFIEDERRALGPAWVDQEYNCMFTALEGLVFPDFPSACVNETPPSAGKLVGGMDFGWRNPFAAVWGILDRDDVLWITHEIYRRQATLDDLVAVLPKKVIWYADPSGAKDIVDLRCRGFIMRKGGNELRRGITAVTARLRTGRLKVLPRCTNLIAEAGLYRYPTAAERAVEGEDPIDKHNHALAALRYLIARLDVRPTTARHQ